MPGRRLFKVALWSVGAVLVLVLVGWLVLYVWDNTALNIGADGESISAETTVGRLECRKTLTSRFPFLTLTCEGEQR